MKIGLIDVDGHNKKTRWGSAFPNLALMKIARYHRMIGDDVEWVVPYGIYDKVYRSKIFVSTKETDIPYQTKEEERGGTGYSITKVLPEEIDRLQPDYSIYPWIKNNEAYGFLTRGCPNKCKWCVVPVKEGKTRPYMDIEDIAIDGRRYVTLMDNNILGAGDYAKEQLQKIIDLKVRVDFNQAMDARLVTDDFARLLAKVKWFPYIRFGCDTSGQIEHCERAIEMLRGYGWNGAVFLYTMITDDFEESVRRVSYWRDKLVKGEKTYPHVQPYLDFNDPSYQPPKWQKDMARWSGIVSLKKTFPIMEYVPRIGFVFSMYKDYPELRKCKTKEEIAMTMQMKGIHALNVRPSDKVNKNRFFNDGMQLLIPGI